MTAFDAPLNLARWELHDPTATLSAFKGRPALFLSRAGAVLLKEPVPWEAYTLEADVAAEGNSGYVGFAFGARDAANFELIYIYPTDGQGGGEVQYEACLNGSATWQVFQQPEYRRPGITMTPGEWTHLRVVVRPELAEVYVGGDSAPHLVVPPLFPGARAPRAGLWGYCPTYVSRFTITRCDTPPAPAPAHPPLPEGVVTDWEIADRLAPAAPWRRVKAEANGTLCFNRWFAMDTGYAVAYARATIDSPADREATLSVGFSDKLLLTLGGEEVCTGETRWNPPEGDGRIRLDTRCVKVRLRRGANEILARVECAEPPFGWGLVLSVS
ncbi:MAG TPA: hypothetical protein VD969_17700 [Symbiobacteriaceae bacterium]|nr:hypothetical protein [Symbiobacteriaceae bacterium]